ncbi:MAG: hypothetical protein P8076_03940 [Gammaproteobacteria bacterium]
MAYRPSVTSALLPAALLAAALANGHANAGEMNPEAEFTALTAMDPTQLDAQRGGDGDTHITVSSTQGLQSTVNGSVIEAGTVASGSVSIAEHALDRFSGVGLFNIVTGNNNAVDAAIGVNFNLQ